MPFDKLHRPLRDLRISVIDRCNFRCSYCMPSEKYSHKYKFLDKQEWLTFDEIVRLVRIFVRLGVVKVRLTGGEPLLRPELPQLVSRLSQMEGIEDLALTTNGSLLAQNVFDLKTNGLKRLTVSLDSLDEEVSRKMNGERASVEEILNGIKEAERAGFSRIKINVVVERGVNDQTVVDLGRYFKGSGHILRFIELMDVGTHNDWDDAKVISSAEIIKMIEKDFPLKPVAHNYQGEVAERYAFANGEGEVGMISSISKPFCGDCSRARLTADGKLYTCLFATTGIDLKTPMRIEDCSDRDLFEMIKNSWQMRADRYSELRAQSLEKNKELKKVEMFQVGG